MFLNKYICYCIYSCKKKEVFIVKMVDIVLYNFYLNSCICSKLLKFLVYIYWLCGNVF